MSTRSDGSAPPWIERRKVESAIEVLENGIEDWDELDSEERNGTLHEALYQLTEVAGDGS